MTDKIDTSAEVMEKKAAMIERHQKRKAARHRINANYAAPDDRYNDIPEILRALAAERDEARAQVALLADKSNCTTIIAHALQESAIATEYVDAFEETLDEQLSAFALVAEASAERDEALAMVAAAYEAAAAICEAQMQEWPHRASDYSCGAWDYSRHALVSIRALTPADARATLERVKDEARREERERCAMICDTFDGPPSDSDFVNGQATAAQQIAAAIRAETDGE